MSEDEPRCMSYLLRLWQTKSGGEFVWRASLESPRSGERTGFHHLEDLFAFLRQQTGVESDPNGDKGEIARQSDGNQRGQQALSGMRDGTGLIAAGGRF